MKMGGSMSTRVTVVYTRVGGPVVHACGCADIARETADLTPENLEVETVEDIAAIVYADQTNEGTTIQGLAGALDLKPRVQHRPVEELPAMRTDATTETGPHQHAHGNYLQPLPACLAPANEDRAASPNTALPRSGQLVVLRIGYVFWLRRTDDRRPAGEGTAELRAAPLLGFLHCEGADWSDDALQALDLFDIRRDQYDNEAIKGAWQLLVDHANGRLVP